MSEYTEDHPIFEAFNKEKNKFLSMKKNQLLKLCKEKKIDAQRDDNDEDLAFLLYRLDENNKMIAPDLEKALEDLGIKTAQNKENNLLLMITFELALIDLLEAEEDEITELCEEFEIDRTDKEPSELVVEVSVAIVNQ